MDENKESGPKITSDETVVQPPVTQQPEPKVEQTKSDTLIRHGESYNSAQLPTLTKSNSHLPVIIIGVIGVILLIAAAVFIWWYLQGNVNTALG